MTMPPARRVAPATRHRGVALLVVLVFVLLSALLALGSARTAMINESLAGNLTDQQRAFMAAEALLRDAQETVTMQLFSEAAPAADGLPNTQGLRFLPQSPVEYTQFVMALEGKAPQLPCVKGFCSLPPDPAAPLGHWWANQTQLEAMWSVGSAYGQYTGATPAGGQAALANGRFWVEVYRYSPSLGSVAPPPDDSHPFVYQLTAVAKGHKPGTRVVLRSVFVPSSAS